MKTRRTEFDIRPRKRRDHPVCRPKRRYASEVEARAGAMLSIEEVGDVAQLWVYRCKHCAGFHLTKQSNPGPMVTAGDPVHA